MARVLGLTMQLNGGTVVLETTEDIRKTLIQVRAELAKMKSTDPGFAEQAKNLKALESAANVFRLEVNKLGQIGYYRQLSAELEQLRNDYRQLTEEELKSARGRELEQKIGRISAELTDLDKRMGLYQRTIGNYRQGLAQIGDILTFGLATGGLLKAIELINTALTTAFNNTVAFSRQLSTIREVSGATTAEMSSLQAEILRVGGNSEFTSQEIAQLAIEYAKLGFSASEIIDVLEATTDIATLSGEALADTASLVGSVLNIYSLETTKAAAAGDILAGVFNRTALDLKRFETGISIAGPAAAAVGIDLQTTAGLLGILADNAIDASTAGTSLRNIFIETANSGKSLQDAFTLILNSQNQLATANALFGKDASVVALTLAKQKDEVVKLISELYNVEGASKIAADRMRKDLKGAVDQLQGATETLGINIGLLVEKPMAAFISALADVVGGVGSWVKGLGPLDKLLQSVGRTVASITPFVVALTVAWALQNRTLAIAYLQAIPGYILALARSTGIIRAVTLVTRGWIAVQVFLNTLLTANPIGLLIVAIGALVSLLIAASTGTSNFARGLRGVIAVTAELAKTLAQFFLNPLEFFKNIGNLGKNLGKAFKAGFASENIGQAVESVATNYERIAGESEAAYTARVKRETAERTRLRQEEADKAASILAKQRQAERDEANRYLAKNNEKLEKLGFGIKPGESFLDRALKVDLGLLKKNTDQAANLLDKALGKSGSNITGDKFNLSRTKARADRTFTPFDYTNQAAEGLERMREELSRLEGEIQNNINAGKPYSEQLKNYFTLTDAITKVEKEWKAVLDARAASLTTVGTSIEFYNSRVKTLQEQLSKAEAAEAEKIIPDLTKAQEQLKQAEDAIKRVQRAAANADFTAVLESDLDVDNSVVEQQRQTAIKAARARIEVEEELQAEIKAINLTADIQLLEIRKRLFREGSDEYLKIENELAVKREELGRIDPEAIRRESDARISANKRVLELKTRDEDLYNAQRRAIELALEAFLIQERLKNFEGGLEAEQELRIKHLDTMAKLEQAHEDERSLRREQGLFELSTEAQRQVDDLNKVLDLARTGAEAASDFIKSVYDIRIAESDRYYDNEIKKAAGNADQIKKLEEEKARASANLRKKEFEQRRKFEIAAASISFAQGIINILTAKSVFLQPFDALYRTAQITELGLQYAAQLNRIKNEGKETDTLFAEGGYTGRGRGLPDKTGFRPVGWVHEDEYVMPKRVLMTPEGSAIAQAAERLRLGSSAAYRVYATGGFVLPASSATPSPYSSRSASIALFTNEQIELMASIIADKVGIASRDGIVDGIEEAVTEQERIARLNLITG